MIAYIISIGTELTLGQTVDTNSAWLSRELAAIGILVTRHITMADELAHIVEVLKQAGQEADLVVVTGGLGPTLDDLTRQALADALGVPLEFRPESLSGIEAFFKARHRPMPEANRCQAFFPRGSLIIDNPTGTAPGIACRIGRAAVFSVPGVPSEMRVMFDQTIRSTLTGEEKVEKPKSRKAEIGEESGVRSQEPGIGNRQSTIGNLPTPNSQLPTQNSTSTPNPQYLAPFRQLTPALMAWAQSGGGQCIRSLVVQTFGMPESELGLKIADLMVRGRNPNVGTTAKETIIGVRINATANSLQEADEIIARDRDEVCRRLGDAVFGIGESTTLADAVGKMLKERGRTVSLAESCTGGLATKMLTDVPGSSAYVLECCVTYTNAAKMDRLGVSVELLKQHGAVSPEVAKAMAEGVRRSADYALAITGIAGPEGGTEAKPVGTVHFALASKTGPTQLAMQRYIGGREQVRDRAAKFALNMLRLELLRQDKQDA